MTPWKKNFNQAEYINTYFERENTGQILGQLGFGGTADVLMFLQCNGDIR